MSVRKSNNELFKMILRMAFIGTLVVANVLFTMVTHRHLWSQKDVLDKRIASSIVEKTVTAKEERFMIVIILSLRNKPKPTQSLPI